MNAFFAAAFSVILFLFPSYAEETFNPQKFEFGTTPKDETRWQFLSEYQTISPGQKFSIALALSHPDGWHSYYVNSGGTEASPEIQWTLPEGFQAGAIQWPTPRVATPSHQLDESNPVKSYQYAKEEAFLIVEITAPAQLEVGSSIEIKGKATWQICNPSCKNEEAELTMTLPVATQAQIDPKQVEAFSMARSRQGDSSSFQFSFEKAGASLRLVIRGATALEDAYYIANHPMILAAERQVAVKENDAWRIDIKAMKENLLGIPVEPTTALGGFLQYTENGQRKTVKIPTSPIIKAPAVALGWSAFWPILLGMFLGGMILNLMPCVFPVIGIKILGFVQQAGQDRRKIILHGLIFALGVLVSFWMISGILYAAKTAVGGEDFGWGYQLQQPWIVLSLMILMFVMALNLAGVFEFGTSATGIGGKLQTKQGLTGTFFSGLLATIVATPCSGPFLGPAIGATMVLPPEQFFTSFTFMAIGLSTPYLILSLFPSLVNFLPRPGAWMETFKQAMSFLLFATAAYLLWVYGGLIEFDNLLQPLAGLICIAIACWIYGRWTGFAHGIRTKMIASVCAIAFFSVGVWISCQIKKDLEWQAWSDSAVEDLLDEDRPVYVDFTAKWCATCQVNKRLAYSKDVIQRFEERGIVALKADKTKPNAAIEKALEELDRSAIPVNVLYIPGQDPIITPENLTSSYLIELIDKHLPKKK